MTSPCPPVDQLERLLAEQLGAAEDAALSAHVEGCAACQQRLEMLLAPAGDLGPRAGLPRPDPEDTLLREIVLRGPDAPAEEPPGAPDGALSAVPGYEVLAEVGRGGAGVVYWAWQAGANRTVALKMLLAGPHAGAEQRARFRTEAEAVGRLQHPNIVQVFQVGEQAGRPFLVMEYVEGGSLAQKLTGAPLPGGPSAELVQTLARAVQAAHERGIVHRDLKPANVLLAPDGTPKIADFGLAKLLIGAGAAHTQNGAILGTPSYMAPEQATGQAAEISPATDVYALGAILYELLTGRPPFRGEASLETLLQVRTEEPVPPRRLQSKVPLDLETICLKCLQKAPHQRYASAAALADDLQRYRRGEPIRARPTSRTERAVRWCRRNPLVAGLAAAVAALLLLTTVGAVLAAVKQHGLAEAAERARDAAVAAGNAEQVQRRRTEELLERQYVDRAVRLLDEGDLDGALLWTVEGLRLVQGDAAREEMHRFRLAAVLRQRPRFVQVWFPGGPVHHVGFSPDGQRVVTASEAVTARVWDAATGKAVGLPLKHTGALLHAEFSPDGRRVVTASKDGTARVWDATTGQAVGPPLRHGDGIWIRHAAFSPDGRRVVTAGGDGQARVWDTDTGRPITPPLAPGTAVQSVAFSPDGRRVVTASADGTARVWDAGTGALVVALKHDQPVYYAEFNRDGTRVVTAGATTARVWDAASGQPIATLPHITTVNRAEFSPDGGRVVTASSDNTAQVWDAATGAPITPPLRHGDYVRQATFCRDGRVVITACGDGKVRQWDATTGALYAPTLSHGAAVSCAAVSPDGGRILTASYDGTARLWVPAGPAPTILKHEHLVHPAVPASTVGTLGSPSGQGPLLAASALFPGRTNQLVYHAAFSPDGRRLATASWDRTAQLWDAVTGAALLRAPLRHKGEVRRVTFSPDGRRVATASLDGTARVWDAATGEPVTRFLPHQDQVFEVSFRPDGKWLLTASLDGKARVWDADTGALVVALKHDRPVRYAEFNRDGTRVVTASDDRTARVWDVPSGALVVTLEHPGPVLQAAFSPDGRFVVTASRDDGTGWVWDVPSGRPVGEPLRHGGALVSARFSPDGRRVLTASADGTARVWDAATGQPVTSPLRHDSRLEHAAFSPDGRRVVTAGMDGMARVWDAATGEPLGPVLGHPSNLWYAAFSPDGRRLVTAGMDARLWGLPFEDRPVADLIRIAQVLTGLEMRAPGQFVPLDVARFHADWAALGAKYPDNFPAGGR
jgi:WD40 repeat protein